VNGKSTDISHGILAQARTQDKSAPRGVRKAGIYGGIVNMQRAYRL
jgi:hypothetical protein